MKVLHVTPSYYPAFQFGGPIQSVHLLNKALRAHGVEVDVFTTNAGLEQRTDIPLFTWQQVEGVPVQYFSYRGYIHYNFSWPLWKQLHQQVKGYDLVHITAVWNFPVLAAARACQKHNIPYIISPRGTLYPETIAIKSASFKKTYLELLARPYLNKAAALHFTAKDEEDKVINFLRLKSKPLVIPNGLDISQFSATNYHREEDLPKELAEQPYLLFLGRIHPKKGLDILVEAFQIIHQQFPDLRLVLAGPDNDQYGDVIRQQVAAAGLTEQVIFTGMLTGRAKLAALSQAKLFVLSSYSENFGMGVVEAMACGTPVVISNAVGISAEIEAHEAGIVTDTTAKSVAEGILFLLKNDQRQQKLIDNGKRMVSQLFDINAVAKAFREAYQEVIDTHS